MSILPPAKTDEVALNKKGYTVSYEAVDDDDCIENFIEFHDCFKEVVKNKDGVVDSPDNLPSVKYFDMGTKAIVGALWIKNGKRDRENAPSAVCERTTETGACGGNGVYYSAQGFYKANIKHNPNGASIIVDELNTDGEIVRVVEEHHLNGLLEESIRRDLNTGNQLEYPSRANDNDGLAPTL